jgi:hypothetical protein
MNRITLQKSKDRGFALALVLLTVMVFPPLMQHWSWLCIE